MRLDKAIKEFQTLKKKKDDGKLNDKKFEKAVDKIKAVSDEGVEWKVDKEGNWYRKENDQWVKDKIKPKQTPRGPQTLLQLVIMIIKSLFTSLPKKLLFFLIIGLITFLVHTYLVIYPNGGFWPGTNPTLDKVLALIGNRGRGTAFWTIVAYLITSLLRKMMSIGPKKIIGGIFTGPTRVVKSAFNRTGSFLTFFLLSTVVFLLLGQFLIKNTAIAYTFAIGAIIAIITFRADLSYLVLRLGYQDFTRLFKRKAKFNDIYFDAYQLAIIVAMILFVFLNGKPLFIYLFCGLSVALVVFSKFRKSNKIAANLFLIGMVGLNLSLYYLIKVYADDGGVAEAGGFGPWIKSQGAGTAVGIGLPPSIGSGIGGLIGIVTGAGDFVGTFVDEVDSDEIDYTEAEGEDIPEEEFEESPEETEEGTMEEEESEEEEEEESEDEEEEESEDEEEEESEDEEGYDEEDVEDYIEDLINIVMGDPDDQLESMINLGQLAAILPGEIGDLINSGQDFVLTSSAMDAIFGAYDWVVPEWVTDGAEKTANESWDYMGVVKDILDLNGNIPEGNPIAELMDWAGITKDALDNIGMGDNIVYAGIKSFLSNKIKSAIFDKNTNPGLIVMDMLTTIFAGGTQAGDIISPGKTIQGGANFIIDKLTDLYNGTDDVSTRVKDGKYGGVWKVADDTTDLIAEGVYNPDEFKKDFENVVTSDDFYEGMYKTNDELWKPAEDSWAIKRAGCYVGHKTTEGLIKVADGVKQLSSWLGSWM
ncbi:MAG: Conserved hypothetical membrane protein [Clostridiales bacterium 38_11]|nr:MAG: Conserved hypothetical membrane protein [Clostridiales bacterium 38_11]